MKAASLPTINIVRETVNITEASRADRGVRRQTGTYRLGTPTKSTEQIKRITIVALVGTAELKEFSA
jgi:hypothetical protein